MEKASAQVESDRTERKVAESILMFCKCTDQKSLIQYTHTWYFNTRVSATSQLPNCTNIPE
jgi:hypothetical protein